MEIVTCFAVFAIVETQLLDVFEKFCNYSVEMLERNWKMNAELCSLYIVLMKMKCSSLVIFGLGEESAYTRLKKHARHQQGQKVPHHCARPSR